MSKTLPAFFCVSQGLLKQCGSWTTCLHRIVGECSQSFHKRLIHRGKSSERALSGNEEECLTFHSFPLINLHDSPLFLPLCAPYVNGSLPLSTSEVEDLI